MHHSVLPLVATLALLAGSVAHADAVASSASVEIKGQRFAIELAEDNPSRELGLMNRTHMDADHGMLFVFQDDAPRAFWMKNTKIPLDMLFFDAKLRLISVQHAVPPCVADPCPGYGSGAPARYVLELNGGQADKLDLHPGDELTLHR